MKKKLALTFFLVALVLSVLVIVVFRIGLTDGEKYSKIVLNQQSSSSESIPFKRGEITDRNGTVLATNEAVYNVILDFSVMNAKETILEPTLTALSQCYGYDTNEIRALIEENPSRRYYRYEKRISQEAKDKFTTYQEQFNENSETEKVKGVWFETEYKRVYPYSTLACDLLGFASTDGTYGSYGVEQYYNDELAGIAGRKYSTINENSDSESIIRDPVDGNTLVTTIDVGLQKIVEDRIKAFNEAVGSKNTAVIIMNPNNGEVLSMATYPFFDLNNPSDLRATNYFTDEEIALLEVDTERRDTVLSDIWRNFITTTIYEPGSTQKPLTVGGGIEEGKLDVNEPWICDGGESINGTWISCVNKAGHGPLDVQAGLVFSCNDCLMHYGLEIGKEVFCKYQEIFGIASKTGIDLPAEEVGLMRDEEDITDIDLVTNAFGQNFNTTMIQLSAAYCSILNGGNYYVPHVVKEIIDPSGSVVKTIDKQLVRQTISKSTSEWLIHAMFATVDNQNGWSTAVEGYEIGGKTGTAEKYPRADHKYMVSMASFVPASNPQYFMLVVVDEPNCEDQSTGGHAITLAHDIWVDALPYLGLYPTRNEEDGKLSPFGPLITSQIAAEKGETVAQTKDAEQAESASAAESDAQAVPEAQPSSEEAAVPEAQPAADAAAVPEAQVVPEAQPDAAAVPEAQPSSEEAAVPEAQPAPEAAPVQ